MTLNGNCHSAWIRNWLEMWLLKVRSSIIIFWWGMISRYILLSHFHQSFRSAHYIGISYLNIIFLNRIGQIFATSKKTYIRLIIIYLTLINIYENRYGSSKPQLCEDRWHLDTIVFSIWFTLSMSRRADSIPICFALCMYGG